MVTTFCLRLALGMIAPLLILPAAIVPPRFFRVQFLSALALIILAGLFLPTPGVAIWISLVVAGLVLLAGSIVWHTDEAPFGRALFFLGTLVLFVALVLSRFWPMVDAVSGLTPAHLNDSNIKFVDDFSSALLLGAAISAMLMGHSYLIAPTMSLSPLNRLLGLLAIALGIRIALATWGLYEWTRSSPARTLDMEATVWLASRWLLGLIIPVGLTWMAWESARLRATQSATGILYVVTITVFLGELLGMLLMEKTGVLM